MNQTIKKTKSVERREALQSDVKSDTIKATKTVTLIALKNTQLPDGTFVGEGKEVEVEISFAERVITEKDTPFRYK